MEIEINQGNGTITIFKVNGDYQNCHEFTKDAILACCYNGLISQNFAQFVADLQGCQAQQISDIYNAQITLANHFDFNQAVYAAGFPNLIIFAEEGQGERFVKHSMIEIGEDIWLGANNGVTLGVPDNRQNLTGLSIYHNISNRRYQNGLITGWEPNTNQMRSYLGHDYKMYRIPLSSNYLNHALIQIP